ncbi:MAG: ATP-binding protein [Candidatus Bathyarchaeota archaeon]|nr:ATP-binding protein [Candidatus Bathyarchaeota archaeon]
MSGFDAKTFLDKQIVATREALGKEKALIAVSGGVDSTVSAAITHRAIGGNLSCVFIDDNFMRLGEPERVEQLLSSPPLGLPVKVLDERDRFMAALKGLKDAEEKRKAFRDTFYKALSDAAKREKCMHLVQGTIRADIEETAAGVKTQHNILEQIGINPVEKYGFRVVEPLVALYKWQVREVARIIGMPEELSERQPFPGPGLSVRVVGEITPEKLDEEKKATVIAEEYLAPLKPSQFFAAIFGSAPTRRDEVISAEVSEDLGISPVEADVLSEKATGVVDGKRTYGDVVLLDLAGAKPAHGKLQRAREMLQGDHPDVTRVLVKLGAREGRGYRVTLRAIKTRDFLTAEVVSVPWRTLEEASEKILEKCPRVSAVYYDVTPKPPATVEFE